MGGISDGSEIVLRAAVKPTPSISPDSEYCNKGRKRITLEIHGRHDPVIVPRAVVVVESMVCSGDHRCALLQYDLPNGFHPEILSEIIFSLNEIKTKSPVSSHTTAGRGFHFIFYSNSSCSSD